MMLLISVPSPVSADFHYNYLLAHVLNTVSYLVICGRTAENETSFRKMANKI